LLPERSSEREQDAFSLMAALIFAGLIGLMAVMVAALRDWLGDAGSILQRLWLVLSTPMPLP